jgi:hypothetical protein
VSALDLLVDVAAVHRLTRLVTEDVITQELRDDVIRSAYARGDARQRTHASALLLDDITWLDIVERDADPPKLAVLVTCRWCASIWIAGGVVAARLVAPRLWGHGARLLALSSAATLLAAVED